MEHTIVYSQGYQPQYLPGEYESGMTKTPIAVEPAEPGEIMSATSRLRFGMTYTVECNVKVRDLGMVVPEHKTTLLRYYQDERDNGFEPEELDDIENEPEDPETDSRSHGVDIKKWLTQQPNDMTRLYDSTDGSPDTHTSDGVADHIQTETGELLPDITHADSCHVPQVSAKYDHVADTASMVLETHEIVDGGIVLDNVYTGSSDTSHNPSMNEQTLASPGTMLEIHEMIDGGVVLDNVHTDSGYASHSRPKTDDILATSGTLLQTHNVNDTEIVSDDVHSVLSDNADINSVASYQTTRREEEGKDFIAQMLAFDHVLRPLCQDALDNMGRARFVRNVRRILKGYYRNLLRDARTERERLCVTLLKSRLGRQRMSQTMADILGANDDADGDVENLIRHREDKATINSWLELLTDAKDPISKSIDLLARDQDEMGFSDSSDDDLDAIDLPHLAELTAFFCDSYSFRFLLNEFRVLCFPASIRDIVLSTPRSQIWISEEQNLTLTNRLKSYIEDYTQLRWVWWPLQPRMKSLNPDQVRLFWRCVSHGFHVSSPLLTDGSHVGHYSGQRSPQKLQRHSENNSPR